MNHKITDDEALFERIYVALLKHPDDTWRVKNQLIYCQLRDRLAAALELSKEETQNTYESYISEQRAIGA